MSELYTIYRRGRDGRRKEIIERYSKLSAILRHNEAGKWTLSGVAQNSFAPLHEGEGIIIYREDKVFLSGFTTEITEEIDETYSDGWITHWSIDGFDDSGLLAHRSIFPDPVGLDIAAASHQIITDHAGNAILEFIQTQGGALAAQGRAIPNLVTETPQNEGEEGSYKARFQELSEFVWKIAKSSGLGVRLIYDDATERIVADAYRPTDRTERVIFAREFGNLRRWVRKRSIPKANAVWVAGQGQNTDRMIAYREDTASIERWGRIEAIKDRRDISDEVNADDPRTPQERLDEAAEAFLAENTAGESYELELAPVPRLRFQRDWNLGDRVTIRIGMQSICATVNEVSIDYANGKETIKPSVGTISRGTLGKTYNTIRDIQQRLCTLERI